MGAALGVTLAVLSGCVSGSEQPTAAGHSGHESHAGHESSSATTSAAPPAPTPAPATVPNQLPGMPPVSDAADVYSDAGAGMLTPAALAARPLVYVPHNSGDVWVSDPRPSRWSASSRPAPRSSTWCPPGTCRPCTRPMTWGTPSRRSTPAPGSLGRGMIDMPVRNTHMGPQDVKLSPDGSRFYIADSDEGGLWVLDGAATQ